MKILVEMKHGLGDCVCVIPMLKVLREKYPKAYIALIVNNKVNEDLINMSGVKIDRYYYLSLKNNRIIDTINTIAKLRTENFDYGILATMTPPNKGKMLFSLIGIKHCLGEQYQGLNFFDLDEEKHFVERNLNVVESIAELPEKPIYPEIKVNERYLKKQRSLFSVGNKKVIGVCIGNGDTSPYKGTLVYTRGWGIDNIKLLIEKLIDSEYIVLLFGGKQEVPLLNGLGDLVAHEYVFNYVGVTTIVESASLAKGCDLVVGVDTGMQHIAAATGVPTLSIFGPTNYKTHGAYASNAYFITCSPRQECQYCFTNDKYYTCSDRRCLTNINVDDVYNQILKIVGGI